MNTYILEFRTYNKKIDYSSRIYCTLLINSDNLFLDLYAYEKFIDALDIFGYYRIYEAYICNLIMYLTFFYHRKKDHHFIQFTNNSSLRIRPLTVQNAIICKIENMANYKNLHIYTKNDGDNYVHNLYNKDEIKIEATEQYQALLELFKNEIDFLKEMR